MPLKPAQYTLDTTPTKVAPTSFDNTYGADVVISVTTPGGLCRLYGSETGTDYVTFTDTDPIPLITLKERDDEIWLAADTGTVDVQVLEQGA